MASARDRRWPSRSIRLALLLVGLTEPFVAAPARTPAFGDFPAPLYDGPVAHVRLVSRQDRLFATMLREAARGNPNFAGHYILASWGCGSPCIQTVAIDVVTGRTTWLPFTPCCWPIGVDDPRAFRRRSRLLVLTSKRDEAGGQGPWRYVLGPDGFRRLP